MAAVVAASVAAVEAASLTASVASLTVYVAYLTASSGLVVLVFVGGSDIFRRS